MIEFQLKNDINLQYSNKNDLTYILVIAGDLILPNCRSTQHYRILYNTTLHTLWKHHLKWRNAFDICLDFDFSRQGLTPNPSAIEDRRKSACSLDKSLIDIVKRKVGDPIWLIVTQHSFSEIFGRSMNSKGLAPGHNGFVCYVEMYW